MDRKQAHKLWELTGEIIKEEATGGIPYRTPCEDVAIPADKQKLSLGELSLQSESHKDKLKKLWINICNNAKAVL